MTEVKDSYYVIVNAVNNSYIQGLNHAIQVLEKEIRTEDNCMRLDRDDRAINYALSNCIEKIKQLIVKQ